MVLLEKCAPKHATVYLNYVVESIVRYDRVQPQPLHQRKTNGSKCQAADVLSGAICYAKLRVINTFIYYSFTTSLTIDIKRVLRNSNLVFAVLITIRKLVCTLQILSVRNVSYIKQNDAFHGTIRILKYWIIYIHLHFTILILKIRIHLVHVIHK